MGIMYKLMKHRNLTMDIKQPSYKKSVKNERNRLITIEGNIIEAPLGTTAMETEEVLSKNMDSNVDKPFTAEHIIQLCKFLAEKSKRNKNLHKQQQSPKKLTKNKQSQFSYQQMECDDTGDNDDGDDDAMERYQSEALPLLSKQSLSLQQKHCGAQEINENSDSEQQKISAILSTRLSPDINSLNISLNTTTQSSCNLQQQHVQHEEPQHHQHNIFHQHQQHQPQLEPQLSSSQGKRDILLKIRRQIFERRRLRENGAYEPQALNNLQVWRPW